jgi:hypothetical protein
MNFDEALCYINNGNSLTFATREDWPFVLFFDPDNSYILTRSDCFGLYIPYAISSSDFDHEWEILDKNKEKIDIS